jgi:hypothetical protein
MNTKRIWLWTVAVVLVTAMGSSYALADNQSAGKSQAAPVILLGATTGIIVGTPIAAARMSGREIKAVFHEYDNDTFAWKFWGRPLCLPVGIIEGTIKGCIAGPKNALHYSKDKPFSGDAFSLNELK